MTPEHFVIHQYRGFIAGVLIISVIGGLAITTYCIVDDGPIAVSLLFAAVTVVCVFGVISLYVWQIEVDGDEVRFRNSFGKVQVLDIHDVQRVTAKPRNMGINEYAYKFYGSDGRKLFSIDENTDDVYLLQRLLENGVEVVYPK